MSSINVSNICTGLTVTTEDLRENLAFLETKWDVVGCQK